MWNALMLTGSYALKDDLVWGFCMANMLTINTITVHSLLISVSCSYFFFP